MLPASMASVTSYGRSVLTCYDMIVCYFDMMVCYLAYYHIKLLAHVVLHLRVYLRVCTCMFMLMFMHM